MMTQFWCHFIYFSMMFVGLYLTGNMEFKLILLMTIAYILASYASAQVFMLEEWYTDDNTGRIINNDGKEK